MNKKITTSIVASFLIATTQLQANSTHELSSITVTSATKTKQSVKDVTSNVSVITKEEIEEKQFTTVTQALNSIAGISFTSNGGIGSTTSLNVRGSDNNRVLILVDGIKYKDHSSISGTDIAHVMIHNIERIEVIKGAQSGIWGADAAAGVINIITKEASLGTHGNVALEYGSFNTKKYEAMMSHASELFDVSLSASKLESNGFTSAAPKGEDIKKYEDDGYENRTINAKANIYLNENSKIGFNVIDIDALKEYDSDVNQPDDTSMKDDAQSRLYKVFYNLVLNNHDIMVQYDQSTIKRDQIGTTTGVKYTKSKSKSFELSDTISYNEKDFFILGIGKSEDKMDFIQADKTANDAQNKTKNIFITNSNTFEDLILTQSLRYDSFDNFNNKTTGKIGAKYKINADFSISSNYGTAYSVPLLMQNVNPWGITNMDIKPEKSKNFDIGFEYKGFKASYFRQEIKDLIAWSGTWPNNTYSNLDGENILKGFELEYKKDILKDTLLYVSYTKLSAKDKDKEDLLRRAKENLKLGVDYYGINKLYLGVFAQYIGTRHDSKFNPDFTTTQVETGNYTVANLMVNYDITKNIKLYGKIDNITDKQYQTVYGYATAPRSAYVGIKASF
jgi:vitamin B12 transporter